MAEMGGAVARKRTGGRVEEGGQVSGWLNDDEGVRERVFMRHSTGVTVCTRKMMS